MYGLMCLKLHHNNLTEFPLLLVPKDVEELLIPSPVNEKQKFYNDVIHALHNAIYSLMAQDAFRRYACSQRAVRWQLETAAVKFVNVLGSSSSSKDGHWINVYKFAEAGIPLKSSDIRAAHASKDFLDGHSKKASVLLKEVKERRANLFHHNEVLPWKANELEFYTRIIEDLMPVINKLASIAGEINLKLKGTSFSCDGKSTIKRKKANAAKSEKEKKQRVLKSACDVLHIICKDGGSYAHRIWNGKHKFVLEMDMLDLQSFDKLLPKFHLRGIKFLLEKGLFADHDGSSKKVTDTAKKLETSLATTSSMNTE